LVSLERAAGREDRAKALGGQALSLAIGLGVALCLVLLVGKHQLLHLMGTESTGPLANDYALAFLTIRALAAPAILTIEAATGVLRGFLDTRTPILILVASNAINLLLDFILIAGAHMGPMGAAIATTSAEWIGAILFLLVLGGKLPSASPPRVTGSTTDPSVSSRLAIFPTLEFPIWEEVQPLVLASSSVFFRAVVLQLTYVGAAAMAARGGGNVSITSGGTVLAAAAVVAAHQIAIQLRMFGSFFCDSLAAAAQGLIADKLGRNDPVGVREVSRAVFQYSFVLGLGLAVVLQLGESTSVVFDLFTRDSQTKDALATILPLLIFTQPLNALVFAADGILQGASEFAYQARSMALSCATGAACFWFFESGSESHQDILIHIWLGMVGLQAMRGLTSAWKVFEAEGPIDLAARSGAK
jgi:putative MATE family efflux protein